MVSQFTEDLDLSDELREQLGIGPSDSLRLLHSEGRTVLLEKVDEREGVAVPWDRDLVLTASVQSLPLADILSMLHEAGKSGFLLFGSGDHQKSVYLHRGEVVFASSNQEADRLGECLFRHGVISLEQLRDAEKRWSPTSRLGKALVERGVLSPRELWNGVKVQVEEIVRSLFAYTVGTVHFWEGEVQPDNVVRLSLPTRRLISEGLRRRDELLRFLAGLEDRRVVLTPDPGKASVLRGNARALFEALQDEGQFTPACRRAGLDPLSGARTVLLLKLIGAVAVTQDAPTEERTSGGAGGQGLRSQVELHVKLIAELLAPLVAIDGLGAVAERVNALITDAAERHPALLEGLRAGAGGAIDPDEILTRANRLPGDRARSVGSALLEIVTYLEFELRNHPSIDDAELYLEATEPLRAQIDL